MFNYEYLQICEMSLSRILQRFECIHHIEFNGESIQAIQANGDAFTAASRPVLTKDGKRALINVDGPMSANPSFFEKVFFGAVDTMEVLEAIKDVRKDDNIKSTALAFNSPGGSAEKIHIVANELFQLSQEKPTASLNVGNMSSAAFFVGSQARKIFVDDEMNMTGSIGTRVMVKDTSEAFKKAGVKVIPIVTGPLKAMGVLGTEVTPEMVDFIKKQVDRLQENFNNAVERTRKDSDMSDGSEARSGASFFFKDAKRLGLVDGVKNLKQVFRMLDNMTLENELRQSI